MGKTMVGQFTAGGGRVAQERPFGGAQRSAGDKERRGDTFLFQKVDQPLESALEYRIGAAVPLQAVYRVIGRSGVEIDREGYGCLS